eukprot:CAMPEP_0203886632 /NCGR_PEP_ID=MMETSP0359-20131031/30420_1 /ASSEMBLY_ACC=CAM_ASM_000338 /TAXON_ID=268821 /ORGANISM="Scrippsiella Hangoei, Strain SHTV-5" /LENGTH=61 /DNA_ID=CAMNT_0050807497 /DNA_START=226 /DNA_END=407 /DNA_ORIENTATION=+
MNAILSIPDWSHVCKAVTGEAAPKFGVAWANVLPALGSLIGKSNSRSLNLNPNSKATFQGG